MRKLKMSDLAIWVGARHQLIIGDDEECMYCRAPASVNYRRS